MLEKYTKQGIKWPRALTLLLIFSRKLLAILSNIKLELSNPGRVRRESVSENKQKTIDFDSSHDPQDWSHRIRFTMQIVTSDKYRMTWQDCFSSYEQSSKLVCYRSTTLTTCHKQTKLSSGEKFKMVASSDCIQRSTVHFTLNVYLLEIGCFGSIRACWLCVFQA